MMSPMPSRSLQTLLMSGSKYLPLRCFATAAPAPLFSHRLLHLRSNFKNLILLHKCNEGHSIARSLSLFIREDGTLAAWKCYRDECRWGGNIQANREVESQNVKPINELNDENKQDYKAKGYRQITESELQLKPLCAELIEYFAERMISTETLRRNAVKQHNSNGNIAIAFPYRRNGTLVSCKYRGVPKKFWQETGTEPIFFGLDDIKRASEVIIVEGEIDKLSMEEAGYPNCVSVPNGAPAKVSDHLPDEAEDTKFKYLWNCKEYLEEATRIVLATDADGPGEALAEELARRLGRERCCRIKWPNKSANEVCKDANEVLMYFGPEALKELVKNAEFYPIRGLFEFSAFFREIDAYYHQSRGFELGISTGWRALDELYKEVGGRTLTVNKTAPRGSRVERTPRERDFVPSFIIYAGNLPWGVDDSRLEQVFSEHGKVLEARVVYDRESGRSRGFGFVKMATQVEVDDAIAALDGQSLDGRAIRVSTADERPRRPAF